MNQSKKILAALVAVPVSVVVADGALAAEATLDFTIKNDFLEGKPVSATTQTVTILNLETNIQTKLNDLVEDFKIVIDGKNKEQVKQEVEKVIGNLQADLSSGDNTKLYGLVENLKVTITESGIDTTLKSTLTFKVKYLADKEILGAVLDTNNLNAALEIDSNTNEIQKIKAVHDFLIKNTSYNSTAHTLIGVTSRGSLSSHSYSLWTYLMIKSLGLEVKYVYGVQDGKYQPWNMVKIGNKWYHLDVAKNEMDSTSSYISYQYFLTNKFNENNLLNKPTETIDSYDIFKDITNSIQVGSKLYYVDEADQYLIKNIELGSLNNSATSLGQTTRKEDFILDSINKVIYFINYTSGKTLFQISESGVVKQVVNESIKSLRYDSVKNKLFYTTQANKNRELLLTNVKEASHIDAIVIGKLNAVIDNFAPNSTEAEADRLNIIELYYSLTESQKAMFITNYPDHNSELQGHIIQIDNKVLETINKIDELSDINRWTIAKINNVLILYKDLGQKQSQVTNVSILLHAENQLEIYNEVLGKIPVFLGKYDTPEKKKKEYYTELDSLEQKFVSLEPRLVELLRAELKLSLGNFENLITAKNASKQEVKAFTDKLYALDDNKADYISDVKKFEEDEYKKIKGKTELYSLLTDNDINKVTEHLNTVIKMENVINEFIEKGYVSEVENIDNTTISPKPTPIELKFIKIIDRIKTLLDTGIKPSQWSEILGSSSTMTSTDFTEKVVRFLERVKTEQEELSGNATKVIDELIKFGVAFPTRLEDIAYTDIATYEKDIENLIEKLEGEGFAENRNNLELIIAMIINADALKVWERHTTWIAEESNRKSKIATDVETFKDKIDKHLATPSVVLTEAEVDTLIKQYDEADIIFKHFVKDSYEKLDTIKKDFEKAKDLVAASALITEMNSLLLKDINSQNVTYAEAKIVWEKYEKGSDILKEAITKEPNKATFDKFKPLWDRLKQAHESAEASKKRVEDLIKEIADLKNTATRAEVEAVEAKLKALTADEQKLVTNSKKLLDLLADIIAKEEAAEKEKQNALDKADADAVIKKIAELTDESTATEIAAVRAEYDALNENAKKLVSARTLELLTYYEARIEELVEIAKKEAAVVQDRINRITSSYTEAQIKNIRMAYNALSTLAKPYVTNLQKLINAEDNIIYQNTVVKQAKIDANAFDVYMNDINRNSTTAEIAKARAYYNRLSQEARKHVTTYEKLVRLETMWKDPEYLDLVFTYYPEYIHEVKPGAIVTQKPTYDPLYIPDDSSVTPSTSPSVATNYPTSASWSAYETMRYQNGRYTTTITSTQVKNNADRNMRLKADNIEIVIPTADLKASTATVGVSVNVSNNQLNIQFTEGNNAKYFSDYVEIHVPFSVLKGNASQIIERVSAFDSAASFKVDGPTFIIRTKSSGTFKAASVSTYNDIPAGEKGTAIRELAKRGIKFDTTSRLSQSYKQVTKMDVALMIATALDLSSNAKSKYLDLESDLHVMRAQGLLEAGIMSGATSARFNPNGTITKQEAAIIIANMYRYLNQDLAKAYNNLNSSYRDVANLTLEARQSIAILELFGVVSGTGSFEPTEVLTRAEFAELLYKALTAINYL